jgi:hypothetical protein
LNDLDEENCNETKFIKDQIVYDESVKGIPAQTLFIDFNDWISQQNIRYSPTMTAFGKKITQKIHQIFNIPIEDVKVKTRNGVCYANLRYKEQDEVLEMTNKDRLEQSLKN